MIPNNNFYPPQPPQNNKNSQTLIIVLLLIIILGGSFVAYQFKDKLIPEKTQNQNKESKASDNKQVNKDPKYIPTPHKNVQTAGILGRKQVKGYDESNRLITVTEYKDDGENIGEVEIYNPDSGKRFKTVHFYEGLISYVYNYDVNTGNVEKATHYYKETVTSEAFYKPQTKNQTKYISYSTLDGSIYSITEYNSLTGAEIKTTYYNKDGTVDSVK
ncbi:MAG: DUF2963 domain-containing protein ['Conium maculatum' witches'-broom phytoplasma]|nr:DUF2963 domain-containing protein ['Conium maculatum' witches'-broom phytoplasma]